MLPCFFNDIYKKPPESRFPSSGLANDPKTPPHLNSVEYRNVTINRSPKLYPIWEAISINSKKHIIIGTNESTGREWNSGVWGFENIEFTNAFNSAFNLPYPDLLTNVAYLADNMLISTYRTGGVDIWSTYSESAQVKNYCLMLVDRKHEHFSPIQCLEVLDPKTAITGGEDFALRIWDISDKLKCSQVYRYAHNDTITGISHQTNNVFATCSRDKSVLLWDTRMVRPALALVSDHCCRLQGLTWLDSKVDGNDNLLVVGDADGFIHVIDKRSKQKETVPDQIFEHRSIRKLSSKGNKLAIIGDTNIVKAFDMRHRRELYHNTYHADFVRDLVWYDHEKLLTVGCDSQMQTHKVPDYETRFRLVFPDF